MSEQKDKRRYNRCQPNTLSNIYQSRSVSSYPLCFSTRSQLTVVFNPRIGSQRSQPQSYANSIKKEGKYVENEYRVNSISSRKPKSLDFKNNLFLKLANKIHKQREIQMNRNEEVLNEYYDETVNKENQNKSNLRNYQTESSGKRSTQHIKTSQLRKSRYEQSEKVVIVQKDRIKFHKLKHAIPKKKKEQELDFVRTSDAQFKITKSSLDMRPLI